MRRPEILDRVLHLRSAENLTARRREDADNYHKRRYP